MKNGTATASGGTNSYGVYDEDSETTMRDVTASASNGGYNAGVYIAASSLTMQNVTASASGGTYNYGVENFSSSPTMMNVTATVSGGTHNYGMWNDNSSPTIQGSLISGDTGDGIHNAGGGAGPYTVTINNSRIVGADSTIWTDVKTYTTKVGASQFVGTGGKGSGAYLCIYSYTGTYTALNATCQ